MILRKLHFIADQNELKLDMTNKCKKTVDYTGNDQ